MQAARKLVNDAVALGSTARNPCPPHSPRPSAGYRRNATRRNQGGPRDDGSAQLAMGASRHCRPGSRALRRGFRRQASLRDLGDDRMPLRPPGLCRHQQRELDHAGEKSFPMDDPEPSARRSRRSLKRLQFFPARLAEIAQWIDMPVDPILPHLVQGDVGREIGVDDDADHRVGRLHDGGRR